MKVVRKPGPGAAQLAAMLDGMDDCHCNVGWLPSAKYLNGMPAAYNAMIHENGVPELNIPDHPMLRPTVERCREKWQDMARQIAKQVCAGKATVKEGVEKLGLHAAAEVKRTIGDMTAPALQKKTILARERKKAKGEPIGSLSKPMMETAYLRDNVSNETGDGKGPQQ